MRKVTAAALTLLTAATSLGFAGCSTSPQSDSSADSKTLTISGWSGDETMEALIARFKQDNPGVEVKFTGLPWPQILTQINTELVSGTASDFVVVFPGNGNPITEQTLAKGNYLEDLSSQSWTSKFNDVHKKVMGVDGKVLMGANNFTIIPAIYNTQALAAVGAEPPTSWTEVLGLCSAAKAKGKVAYAMAGLAGGTYNYLPYALTASLVYQPDSDFVAKQEKGQASFSDSGWTTALNKFAEMQKAGCFSKDTLGTSLEVAQGQVAKGEALGIVTVSNQIGDVERAAPEGTTFQTAALPATDTPAETVLPVGLGSGYGVNAKAKNKALANKFMEFYLSDEGMKVALDAGSIFPSIPQTDFKPSATLAGVSEQVQNGKTAAFPDQTWPNSNVTQVYQDQVQKVLGGQTSVTDALSAMDAAYGK